MRHTCRVFLKTGVELRKFFWFSLGVDGSVYFSSSNSREYKKGFHGSSDIPVMGVNVDPRSSGRPLSKTEIDNYHSLHQSGIFSQPTLEGGRRQRHQVLKLEEYGEPVPLVAIFPMQPIRYPISPRKPKLNLDMVIDVSELSEQPFAMMFYIKGSGEVDPPVVGRKDWPIYGKAQVKFGNWQLGAIFYADPISFVRWDEMEMTITCRPDGTGKLAWPIFSSSYT